MNHWTDSAKAKLEEYFARIRQTLAASGADVNEVTDDLRRHVEEEVAARQLAVVTEQDVGSIPARIGAPEMASAPADRKSTPPPAPAARKSPGLSSIVVRILVLLFGVVLPFATIGFE